MDPLRGRSRRARLGRIAPLLIAIFVAILVASPDGPPHADAGDAFQVSEGLRLEGPSRVVARDLPPATTAPPGQIRELRLSRRHPSHNGLQADVPAPSPSSRVSRWMSPHDRLRRGQAPACTAGKPCRPRFPLRIAGNGCSRHALRCLQKQFCVSVTARDKKAWLLQ